MSLYLFLGIVAAAAVLLRFRYGSEIIPYAAAALLLILFLYCPTGFREGGWIGTSPSSLEVRVDRLGEIVSFGLLIQAAWMAGRPGRKGSN